LGRGVIAAALPASATSSVRSRLNCSVIPTPLRLVEDICFSHRHLPELALERAVIEEVATSGLAPG